MDVQKLLNQFLGAGGQGGRHGGFGGQPGGYGGHPTGRGGSVIDQIGSILGGGRGPGSSSGGGLNSALAGALASGLASQLFRGRSMGRMGGSAMKLGGAAIVAGIAYKAFQSWQASQNQGGARAGGFLGGAPGATAPAGTVSLDNGRSLPLPEGTPFLPRGQEEAHARLVLSAMIAAAKADGYIDQEEERAIFGRMAESGLDAEEQRFLSDEMRRPMSISELASRATTPELAAEVYTASLLAIDADHPAEQAYLQRLASSLRLPHDLVAEIHRTTGDVLS